MHFLLCMYVRMCAGVCVQRMSLAEVQLGAVLVQMPAQVSCAMRCVCEYRGVQFDWLTLCAEYT